MIINTPVSQDEYIKLIEEYINSDSNKLKNNNNNLIKQSLISNNNTNEIINKLKQFPKSKCLLNLSTQEWDLLISEIIKINPSLKNNNNNCCNFGFNLLWGKLFISKKQYIKREEFLNQFISLYTDIELLLGDGKLLEDAGSIESLKQQLSNIHNRGNHFNDLLMVYSNKENNSNGLISNLLKEEHKVNPLDKYYLLSDEQLKTTISNQFQSFKTLLEETIEFLSLKMYCSVFGNLLSVTMLIYSTLLRDCINYQYYFSIKNQDSETSLKMVLHNEIMKFHNSLGNSCNKFCLSAIRPATTIIPWMNLPFNGQVLYGRINELDLIQYPNSVERLNDDYGNGIVNCDVNGKQLTTFKVSPHYFNLKHSTGHTDNVSGFNSIMETFISSGDFINFNIIKNGGNDFINGYTIKLHLSTMYQGDSYFKVQIGDSDTIHTINTLTDLTSNELTSFQVLNFKMLYNINLAHGTIIFSSSDSNSNFKLNQKLLNFKIFNVSNIVLNSIDITLE